MTINDIFTAIFDIFYLLVVFEWCTQLFPYVHSSLLYAPIQYVFHYSMYYKNRELLQTTQYTQNHSVHMTFTLLIGVQRHARTHTRTHAHTVLFTSEG